MRSSRYEPYNSGPKNASCPNSAKSGLCGEFHSYSEIMEYIVQIV